MPFEESKCIYQEAFGIDDEFDDKLFTICRNNLKTIEIGGRTVSQLFLLPVNIVKGEEIKKAYYLFAAATKREYRGKGYMSKLILQIIKETQLPIFLKPANNELINFYKQFGFKILTAKYEAHNDYCILPRNEFLMLDAQAEKKSGSYTAMIYSREKIDIENITFSYTME